MNTIEELIDYCQTINPVGALLLTGEWGCGKTYLIDNELREKLQDKAIIIRISLFGVTSMESLNSKIKNMWINAYMNEIGSLGKAGGFAFRLLNLSRKLKLPESINSIVSVDFESMIEVRPIIGKEKSNGKQVILVFDDLERAKIDVIDILGNINDYCENKKFHTIIIANEEKVNNNNNDIDSLSYSQIKEKIVQRTIKIKPDYRSIVHEVIDSDYIQVDNGYKDFLKKCEDLVFQVFASEDSTDKKPHNIRSLKCALQDFYRIYKVLVENQIAGLEERLQAFLIFILASKADIAAENHLFVSEGIKEVFTSYKDSLVFDSVKKWIKSGEWDEDDLIEEITLLKEQNKTKTPIEYLRNGRIVDLEDSYISDAMDELLGLAYNGELTLDEYVQLIYNDTWADAYKISTWKKVNWDLAIAGIHKRIDEHVRNSEYDVKMHLYISPENEKNIIDTAIPAWHIIRDLHGRNTLAHMINKKNYCEQIQNEGISGLLKSHNRIFNCFDKEMAELTFKAFAQADNFNKCFFPEEFNGIFGYRHQCDFDIHKSIEGFTILKNSLKAIKNRYESENKPIAQLHTEKFIEKIEEIIAAYSNANQAYVSK